MSRAPVFKTILAKRLLSGFILAPIVLVLIWWRSISFLVLIGVVSTLMLLEFYTISEQWLSTLSNIGEAKIPKFSGFILGLGICLSSFSSFSSLLPSDFILFISVAFPMLYYLIKRETAPSLIKSAIFLLGIIYIPWTFGRHILLIYQLKNGPSLVTFLVAIVWIGDTGAYFFGTLLGKHKLISSVSPNKTVEGSLGGLCFSVIGGVAVQYLLLKELKEIVDLKNAIFLSLILAISAQIGDLCESLLKRSANVKDSGTIIPGHGGMLDRCDAMIFATPVLYYCIIILLPFEF